MKKNKWNMTEEDIEWLLIKLKNHRRAAAYEFSTISPDEKESDMLIGLVERELRELKDE